MVYTDGVHLIADSWEELEDFAIKMGLKAHFFHRSKIHAHYDLTTKKKSILAVDSGAIKMSSRELFKMMIKKGIWKPNVNRRKKC